MNCDTNLGLIFVLSKYMTKYELIAESKPHAKATPTTGPVSRIVILQAKMQLQPSKRCQWPGVS